MGITEGASTSIPGTKAIVQGYREIRNDVKRINVNQVNVRFYPSNSPTFFETKGELFHYTDITVLKIEVPDKLAFIVQDDSIMFNKATKEEWVDCRQDYPMTLAVNKQLRQALKDAMIQFPDITEWYVPSSINKIPVKNIIINYDDEKQIAEEKAALTGVISQNIVAWMDKIESSVKLTPKFLYDYADVLVIGSLKEEASGFNWSVFIMGGLCFSLVVVMLMLYVLK